MRIELTGAFLAISLLFYCLFGGADFGAGILEIFTGGKDREKQKELIAHAIGPVWEANHMWLVLAVVILFNGFPKAYVALSTTYYIPLTLLLVGIIFRGCAFTFGRYDAVKDGSQHYYSLFFKISGVMVPMTLGMIAGGTFLGKGGKGDFASSYISPWFNFFSFSVGLFTCALFGFLAAIYLVGETHKAELQELFTTRARTFNVAAILTGLLVFISAQGEGFPLASLFITKPLSALSMAGATVILVPLWLALKSRRHFLLRGLAMVQVALVLAGWFSLQFPVLIATSSGAVTLTNAAAPEITLKYLLLALAAGCLLIFPSLFYLFKIFKYPARKDVS